MRKLVPIVLALAALPLSACGKASTDVAFDAKVKAYLMAHPEVVAEAIAKLQAQKQAEADKTTATLLNTHRAALERDPRDFVVNPNGKVTVVEFFDYQCGFCKLAAPEVVSLIKADPDIRFVFKEFVIFGPQSEAAARAAIGAGRQGKYFDVYQRFMAQKAISQAALPALLQADNVDVAKAESTGADPAVTKHLKDVHDLAVALHIEGTPAFIVGDTMVPGADMEVLRAAIARARGKAA
jgi:protein-disulfide isomerase